MFDLSTFLILCEAAADYAAIGCLIYIMCRVGFIPLLMSVLIVTYTPFIITTCRNKLRKQQSMRKHDKQINMFVIDGNIGSGKSTFISDLRKHLQSILLHTTKSNIFVRFIDEPVQQWESIKDETGVSIIERFYADQSRYAFMFQIMAYVTQLSLVHEALDKTRADIEANPDHHWILISERSVHTNCHVFADMLHDSKNLSEIEMQIYMLCHNEFVRKLPEMTTIYLRAPADVCLERVKKRHRAGEVCDNDEKNDTGVNLNYLTRCHDWHEKYIEGKINAMKQNKTATFHYAKNSIKVDVPGHHLLSNMNTDTEFKYVSIGESLMIVNGAITCENESDNVMARVNNVAEFIATNCLN